MQAHIVKRKMFAEPSENTIFNLIHEFSPFDILYLKKKRYATSEANDFF